MTEYQIVSYDTIPDSRYFGGDLYCFQHLEHLEHLYLFALDDKDFSKIILISRKLISERQILTYKVTLR